MLKIGYFALTKISKSETFILDLIKGLSILNDVTFITGSIRKPDENLPVKTIISGFHEKYAKTSYRLHKLFSIKGNKAEFMEMRFNQWKSNRLLNNCKLSEFDVAYIDYATTGIAVMDYLDKKNIPFILHVHGYDITAALNNAAYQPELEKLFNKAAKLIAASNYMKRRLVLLGCEEEKIQVINYEITHQSIVPLTWHERLHNTPSIIFLGRLTTKKNPVALLHAFKLVQKQIPTAKLSIIGDGPLKEEVEKVIHKLDLTKSVKLYGALSREQSFPIINNHWIYAQHSVTAINGDTEGFALSLAEAALHELPVVSTIHNGIPENVIDNTTGYLVPEYDYETMAEKIIYLIKNPDIAEKMGKAGRQHIMNICEPGKRIGKIETILNELVSTNN